MSLIVQKYGGTSVGSLERIRRVAERVQTGHAAGHQLVVVVSAMAGETNRLLAMGRELSLQPSAREMDALVATGEQVSAALLSIVLQAHGVRACSLLAHQLGLETDAVHNKARIMRVKAERLAALVAQGIVPVVAGFQGIDADGNITTLGRGGTDTTAVAIAAALKADSCEIYTDVDGVYTADPNLCPNARKVERISYEEMLELASLGAKVLQIRSVELAMKFTVPVHVRSSFAACEGTMVVAEQEVLESVVVAGVTADHNEVKLTIRALSDHPGVVAQIFEGLAESSVSVDMIIQNVSSAGSTDLTFTVTRDDAAQAEAKANTLAQALNAGPVLRDEEVVKVSIVGQGMRSHAGVAARMFRLLADEGINIEAISTSEIKVSCLIRAKYAELAVRVLHDGFALGSAAGAASSRRLLR
ncbi:MAG: aspartate kinase [Polyangiales bacterium]